MKNCEMQLRSKDVSRTYPDGVTSRCEGRGYVNFELVTTREPRIKLLSWLVLICFLLVFTLIVLSLLWQHRGTRQDVIDKHNPREAKSYRENITYQEDTFTFRDKSQLELFDDAELSRMASESAIYRRK